MVGMWPDAEHGWHCQLRTVAGGNGHHNGGRELGGEAAGVGDLGHLHAQAAGDVAGEQRQAAHDAGATNDQDPLRHINLQRGWRSRE